MNILLAKEMDKRDVFGKLTIFDVEKAGRQNRWAQETQENRCAYQIISHVFTI